VNQVTSPGRMHGVSMTFVIAGASGQVTSSVRISALLVLLATECLLVHFQEDQLR